MDLGLNDKVAAVTASSQGLGQAIAMELAQEGAKVSICARREGPLDETKAAIEAAGGEVHSCVADMSKREDVERFVNDTAAHFGRLDILVNNAGDAAVGRTIEDSDEVWEQTYDINLWSAVRATRAAVPLIREQGGGSIINVASVSGHSGLGGMADYNSAKAAMLAMTKTLAQDLAGRRHPGQCGQPGPDSHSAVGTHCRRQLRRRRGRERRRGLHQPRRSVPADQALRAAGRGRRGRRIPRVAAGELRDRRLLERRRRLHEVPDLNDLRQCRAAFEELPPGAASPAWMTRTRDRAPFAVALPVRASTVPRVQSRSERRRCGHPGTASPAANQGRTAPWPSPRAVKPSSPAR